VVNNAIIYCTKPASLNQASAPALLGLTTGKITASNKEATQKKLEKVKAVYDALGKYAEGFDTQIKAAEPD
jgi:hypothetical protein